MNARKNSSSLNLLLVSAYRAFGFAALTLILGGLISYLAVNVFYFVNSTWLAPTIISPSDERVLQLNAQYAEQLSRRESISAEKLQVETRLKDTERVATVQEQFQDRFKQAIRSDLASRLAALETLQKLTREYEHSKADILRNQKAFSGLSKERTEELAKAKLIERDQVVSANYQLSQIAQTQLSLAEREAQLKERTEQIQREVQTLQSSLKLSSDQKDAGRAVSYEKLMLEREYVRSVLEGERARDENRALTESLAGLNRTLERYDQILKSIQSSPYIKATTERVTIAFVPYDNLKNVKVGSAVYGCELGVLWCREVGQVAAVLSGEVTLKHPLYNRLERGLMVQVDLKEASFAERNVLFARRPPLLL